MKKNILLLAGLLVTGLGLTACGGTAENSDSEPGTHVETSTTEKTETEESTQTEESTEGTTPAGPLAVVSGKFSFMGEGEAFIILEDEKNVFFDIDHSVDFCATAFDKRGTYKIEDGVITCTVKGQQAPNAPAPEDEVIEIKRNDAGKLAAKYVLHGSEGDVPINMSGDWCYTDPIVSGKFSFMGEGEAFVKLTSEKEVFFDIDHSVDFCATAFDKKGTYKIENGVITLTVKGQQAPNAPAPEDEIIEIKKNDAGKLAAKYVLHGSEGDVPINMTGSWPTAAAAK